MDYYDDIKRQRGTEEAFAIAADDARKAIISLARVTEERDRLLERNKTLAETAMRATARANGQEVEVEKSLIFIRDVLAEWNSAEADRDALRARVATLEADNARLRDALREAANLLRRIARDERREGKSPMAATKGAEAAEAALKGGK